MSSFDPLQKHQILNCGDMKKDGKELPNITNDAKSLFNYARNFITEINCETEGKSFEYLKKVINGELLENVKKYCFGTLLPIPEDKVSNNNLDNITFINKNSRKVVPINVTNAFIDAAMDPSKYFLSDKINICETPASNIDPGSREKNKNFYPDISANYPLYDYGFREDSKFNYNKNSNVDEYKYIEIILDSNNYFKGLVDRTGKIGDDYRVCLDGNVYNKSNSGNYSDIFENLFQGNTTKNTYIFDNKDSKDDKIKMLCTLLIFFKELGDTTQPIVISQLFGKQKVIETDKRIERDNTCLLTIDTILACRCALLNVPYLLNSSSIITYYAAIGEAEYIKNMKLSEIQKTKLHNEKIIKEYKELLTIIEKNSNTIPIAGVIKNINKIVIKRFNEIIHCIGKANQSLEQLKQYLEYGTITTDSTTDYEELKTISFEIFRNIVQSLQAQSIFVYRGTSRKIITGKYYVFPQKLMIEKKFFTWDENCLNSIMFQTGVFNYISASSRLTVQKGGTKEIGGVVFQDNEYNKLYCYSLLYPYIYCNPYLLPYILKKKEQELIDFLNQIIANILGPDYIDIIPESIKDEINNLYSEELLYYLYDSNKLPNMYEEIDNYEIYTNKLLEKLDDFVKPENNPDISQLLEPKSEELLASSEDLSDAPAASSSEDLSDAPAASSTPAPYLTVQTNLTDMDVDSSPPPQTPPPSQIPRPLPQTPPPSQIPRPLPQTPPPPPIKKETSQGKRQRLNEAQNDRPRSPISFGGKKKTKNKNKNKKVINKKTKKKYKSKLKIVYKKKNTKKRISKKKKINKKVKNTKKKKNKN